MSEAALIEKPCVEFAESFGWQCRKMDVGPGGRGWPDQVFFGPNNRHFIVEFKMPGGIVSPKQRDRMSKLIEMGHTVYVIESVDWFKRVLAHYESAHNRRLIQSSLRDY